MDTICIFPAKPEHIDSIAAIEHACFTLPWSRKAFAAELELPDAIVLTALCGETVAGFLTARLVLDECCINNVAVTEQYRCKGVGAALLTRLDTLCKARSIAAILLEVRASNSPALALYERCGYVRCGLRGGFYERPREDAVLMTKNLLGEYNA